MSLNINQKILDVASSVVVTIDTNRLGPRQLTSYKRQCKTGVITERSISGSMALSYRRNNKMPWIYAPKARWMIEWNGLEPDNALFATFNSEAAALRLTQVPQGYNHAYHLDQVKEVAQRLYDAAEMKAASGKVSVYAYRRDVCKAIAATDCKLPEGEAPLGVFSLAAWDGQRQYNIF